jgi:hypothetical protein
LIYKKSSFAYSTSAELLSPIGLIATSINENVAKIEQHVARIGDDLEPQNLKAFRKFEIFFLQRKMSTALGIELR